MSLFVTKTKTYSGYMSCSVDHHQYLQVFWQVCKDFDAHLTKAVAKD